MSKMYYKQVDLQEKFDLGATFVNRVCHLIDDNADLYEGYGRIGKKVHICAFLHAYKFWQELEAGKSVQPFDPKTIEKFVLDDQERDAIEAARHAENQLRTDLILNIVDWFDTTEIPDNISIKQLVRVIKRAMVALVTE